MQKDIDTINQSMGSIDLAQTAIMSVFSKLLQENQQLRREIEDLKKCES